MPVAPPSQGNPASQTAAVTLEQEQLNNFLGPVNGALGGLPVAEQTQEYFAVYTGAGGTGPEIIDETAIFISYLVDENGNISKPSENFDSLTNLLQNFEVGKNLIIRNDIPTAVNAQVAGKQKITAIGRQLPIAYSQTGSSDGANVNTLNFNSDLNQSGTPRMEGTMVRGVFTPTVNTFQTVTNYNSPISEPDSSVASFDSTAGTYTVISSAVGDVQTIFFEVSIGLRLTPQGPAVGNNQTGIQTRDVTVRIKRDSTVIGTKTYTIQGSNVSGESSVFNFESDPLTIGQLSPFFTSGDPVYTVEIQFEDTTFCTADFIQFKILNQTPSPSNPEVTPNYWSNNSGTNFYLTASANLSINYGNTQNSQNVLDEIEPGFNFSPIQTPFLPRPGDRIRFEYNKETEYTIYEVIEPDGDVEGLLRLKLNALVPTTVNLNNFVLHRVDSSDPAYIIVDVPKNQLVSSNENFKGILLPEYPTKKLRDNIDKLVLELKEKGILPNT